MDEDSQDDNVVDLREDELLQLSVECTDDAEDSQVTRGDRSDEDAGDFVDLDLPTQCTELQAVAERIPRCSDTLPISYEPRSRNNAMRQ